MELITAVPLEAIRSFLYNNDIVVPNDSQEAYQLAYDLIRSNKATSAPIPVIDWITAVNLFNQKQNIVSQNASYILTATDKDLQPLARQLTLSSIDKERILRILGYLKLLNNDMSIFDKLNDDALSVIIYNLDCKSALLLCKMSSKLNNYCKTNKFQQVLSNSLQRTGLNLKGYTLQNLIYVCNIRSRRYPTMTSVGPTLYILSNGIIYEAALINDLDEAFNVDRIVEDLPNIIQIQWYSKWLFALTDDGNVYGINEIEGYKYQMLQDISNIIYMIPGRDFKIIRADGQILALRIASLSEVVSYRISSEEGNVVDISLGECISLTLTDDGYIYDGEHKLIPQLNNIISISAGECHSLALSADNTVYSWGINTYGQLGLGDQEIEREPTQIPGLDNIIQVMAGKDISMAVSSNGEIYRFGRVFDHLETIPEIIPDIDDIVELYQTNTYKYEDIDVDDLDELYEFDRQIYNFQIARSSDDTFYVFNGSLFYTFEIK